MSRNSEMVDCYAAFRPGGLFKKCNAVSRFVFGEEEIPAQVSVTWFKVMGEIWMPARSHSLKENCLRRSCDLEINAAGRSIFDRIQILVDGGLLSLIDKRIQRGSVCLIINDKQGIALHKSGGCKDICPEPENTVILFEYNDGRLHKAVLNKQSRIIFAAHTKARQVGFDTIQRLLL